MAWQYTELIDTLWNVNLFKSNGYSTGRQGINRYIMECKSKNAVNGFKGAFKN